MRSDRHAQVFMFGALETCKITLGEVKSHALKLETFLANQAERSDKL